MTSTMRVRADLRQKVMAIAVEWNHRCDRYEAGGAALCNGVATGLLMALDIIGEQHERKTMVDKPTIGRIVLYHDGSADAVLAAIVTMTPEQWLPGSRDADGEWVATTDVPQPKAHTVHLHVFAPFGHQWTPEQQEIRDVPNGETAGCWSWPPRV